MSDDWALAGWDGATVHGDPRDRITNQRRLDLDNPPPLPEWLEAFAAQVEAWRGDYSPAPDPELVAKVRALLDSPHAGEREAARAALDRLAALR